MCHRLTALLLAPALLLLATPALGAPVVGREPAQPGILDAGEQVLIGVSDQEATTVTYTTQVDGDAPARLLRVSCFFWCQEQETDAATVGQEVLRPYEAGERLYLIAPADGQVAFTATVTPGNTGLGLCPATPPTDVCTPPPGT